MNARYAVGVAVLALVSVSPAIAQEPSLAVPPPAQPSAGRRTPAPVPLKVTVVLSRYQGDKRVSSMPYVLGVMASGWGPGPKTTLRMGVEVPVATTVFTPVVEGKTTSPPMSSYNYRSVGTNIDCGATFDESTSGLFQLSLTVSDSSLGLGSTKQGGQVAIASDMPSFRNFNSSFTALLREGQTMQYTSATDPVTGELMKIDVTVNLMK